MNRSAEPPIYLAQHRDFRVVYTHLTTHDLFRTVERLIVSSTTCVAAKSLAKP